jgi:4-hydroxy-tetrahydrodipicolinate synthase
MKGQAMPDRNLERASSWASFGISAALATPFRDDGSVDTEAALAHASWVLTQGANGITLFGTTGEGASLGMQERSALLDAMLNSGIAADQIIVTLCSPSIAEAVCQARSCLEKGVRRMLATPPFYFKSVSDDALFSWYSQLISETRDADPRYILYHIPQMTGIPLTVQLIEKLKATFGDMIFGVKDSSGNWENTAALLKQDDLSILVGDERHLARAAALGAAGAISGMANLFPGRLLHLVETGRDDPQIIELVDELVQSPVTAAVKSLIAEVHNAPGWRRTRAPLEPTPEPARSSLARMLRRFEIDGL